MALVELSIVEQRYHAVREVLTGARVTDVAGRYGVSRQSVHTWVRRYREGGWARWPTAHTESKPADKGAAISRHDCVDDE